MAANPKDTVVRLIEGVMNRGNLDLLDELCSREMAGAARQWIGPFREAFPDFTMEIVDLIAEGGKVAAHFKCSGTHQGKWRGHSATGKRFDGVDEIYIFQVDGGRLRSATAVEDNLGRMRQLGFEL